jgi:DNA polymerase-3 subunit delta
MTRDEFLKQVETGQLLPVYLLLGEETYFYEELIRMYLNQLLGPDDQEFNYLSLDASTTDPQEYIRNLETPPFFGAARVIRLEGLESGNSGLDEAVLKGLNCLAAGVYQIITAVKLDGRKKLHQEIQRRIVTVDCNKLKPFDLPNWIRLQSQKMGLHLTTGQTKTMAERLGNDLRRIWTELEKLKTFTHGKAALSDADLDALIPGEPEPDIFGLIDAVALRNGALSMSKLKDLLDSGENELKILATLARQFRNITGALSARDQGMNFKTLAEVLGINPYVAEKSFVQSGPFTLSDLQKIMERLLWADYRMKSGQREPRLELELALIEITTGNFSAKSTNFL